MTFLNSQQTANSLSSDPGYNYYCQQKMRNFKKIILGKNRRGEKQIQVRAAAYKTFSNITLHSLVELNVDETWLPLFFKALIVLPNLKDVSCELQEKKNELVLLFLAMKNRKYERVNVRAGFVDDINFADDSPRNLIIQGYMITQLASIVSTRFHCYTGTKTHNIFLRMFYTAADKVSRRKVNKKDIPRICVGAFLDAFHSEKDYKKLSETVQLYQFG